MLKRDPSAVAGDAPLFSVITVVRNDLPGLIKTGESLAVQCAGDFEWVVIDGNSNDGTEHFARDHTAHYLSFSSEPDAGLYDAMNKGLERARGKYVVFLNAGDVFATSDTLNRVREYLKHADLDLLYGDSLEIHGGVRRLYKAAKGHERVSYGMFACHQSMYFRRAFIGALRYDSTLRVAGDYLFAACVLRQSPRIRYMPEALCVFDLRGISSQRKRWGRVENWAVQRDALRLSLPRRCANRIGYKVSATLAERLPALYRLLRYRASHGS